MKYGKLLAGLAAGLLFYAQAAAAAAAAPQDAPKDVKYILGFYYGNGENILIRENNGGLDLLYRTRREDKSFAGANVFPLVKEHFDSYVLYESGPMSSTEAQVSFERDTDGYGISCRIGGHTYTRFFMGQGTGERAVPFRLPAKTAEEWEQLRAQTAEAAVPAQLEQGTRAELVNAASVPGLKVDSRYASADNCFGAPLYTVPELYLSSGAAEALAGVQRDLQQYGYGLLLWDAYRPWSVSKLASLALPENSKDMLENPDTQGSSHNTGNAVDVSLYSLETGLPAEMSSGFDEPSFRQYASYPGGTSLQRWQRGLLRETMERHGFTGIEMEWWHFEYAGDTAWAHLNVPLEQLG